MAHGTTPQPVHSNRSPEAPTIGWASGLLVRWTQPEVLLAWGICALVVFYTRPDPFRFGELSIFFGRRYTAFRYTSLSLSGVALASVLWQTGLLRRHVTLMIEATVLLASAALTAGFICITGMRHFNGADMSTLVDVGWRLLQGQRLYEDFISPLPPGFALGSKWAFEVWGVNWGAMVYVCAVYAVMTLVWIYLLLRALGLSAGASLLLATCAVATTQVLPGYWWYNGITNVAAIVLYLSSLLVLQRPARIWAWTSVVAALVLVGLMKPNAWPLGLAAVFVLATSRVHRPRLVACLAAAAGLFWLVARLGDFDPAEMWASYRGIAANRGNPLKINYLFADNLLGKLEMAIDFLLAVVMMVPALVWTVLTMFPPAASESAGAAARDSFWNAARVMLLTAAAFATGLILVQTNMELKFTDLVVILVPSAVLAFLCPETQPTAGWLSRYRAVAAARFFSVWLAVMLILGSFVWGWQRVRVFCGMPFWEPIPVAQRDDCPRFFRSMTMGRQLDMLLHEVGALLRQTRNPTVLFGPRIQVGYAAFGLPSPRTLPIAWDSGTMYPRSLEPELVRRFDRQRPDLLVFLRDTYTYMPIEVLEYIADNYLLVDADRLTEINVYIRKGRVDEVFAEEVKLSPPTPIAKWLATGPGRMTGGMPD
jgi:hypothetical protein